MFFLLLLACLPLDAVTWTVTSDVGSMSATVPVTSDDYEERTGSLTGILRARRDAGEDYTTLEGDPVLGVWEADVYVGGLWAGGEMRCARDVLEVDTGECRVRFSSSCTGDAQLDVAGDIPIPGGC